MSFAGAMATRLDRLAGAVDGVTLRFDDERQLAEDMRRALRFGFTGKLCIHPNQVPGLHAAFAPHRAGAGSGARAAWMRAAAGMNSS